MNDSSPPAADLASQFDDSHTGEDERSQSRASEDCLDTDDVETMNTELFEKLMNNLWVMQQSKEAGDNPEDFGVSPVVALSIYEKDVEEAASTLNMLLNQGERDALLFVLNKLKSMQDVSNQEQGGLIKVF